MWRFVAAYLVLTRPQVAVGVVVFVVVFVGGVGSLPQLVRPVQAAGPVIQPIALVQPVAPPLPDTSVDCANVACLALTFDDGPDTELTPRVLDVLAQHRVKATFFLVGAKIAGKESIVQRIHADGHEIGNHTWSHRKINELSPQELQNDIAHAQHAIAAAGAPTPRLFRPPYGLFSPMIRSHVPMTIVSWNVDPEDWKAKKPEKVTEHVLAYAKPGAIVVLHDTEKLTADALDPLLAALEQQYHLVTVSELLGISPGQPGIFYGR